MSEQPTTYTTGAWKDRLEQREQQEVAWARLYAVQFQHGTSGHLGLMTLARLATVLDELEADLAAVTQERDAWRKGWPGEEIWHEGEVL